MIDVSHLYRFRKKRDELDYMGEGGLAPLSNKQRWYIKGLLDKLDCTSDDYGYDDLKDLTIIEAMELIEQLLEDKYSRGIR